MTEKWHQGVFKHSVTLCLGVPYDIVQTNKKGECDICVALDVDVDVGVFVDVTVVVAVATIAVTTITAVAAAITAATMTATTIIAVAADTTSVPAPGARRIEKGSATDIGRALMMHVGVNHAAFLSPGQQRLNQAAVAQINH